MMSGVADAGAGPPAGEVRDDVEPVAVLIEPARAADDAALDAVLSTAGTDVVPDTAQDRAAAPSSGGESDAPAELNEASRAAESDGAAELDGATEL
ncbi:MAG TPA: hypothetical protein VJ305_22705, partial [Streptosporangiaceae bacterium]|nr:hypothetical protein [Streptosporangiaceae bacterium]